ncbi:MAG: zinc-binding dehydrogenase [Hyphomicrobiaceae bacterium]|nr:zinc-binding dehydrogenase [Hyphomicrobiaceae bacterium]
MSQRQARAAVYDAPNTPFVIRDYPLRDVRPDEVLVRISMSTICRSDIHSWEGHRPNPCPGILGHEIIGVIDQLGSDIERDMRGDALAVGDRITWTEYFHHGESYYRDVHDMPQKSNGVRKYGHDLVEEDPHFLGGFAEYCYVVPGTGILKLPDDLSDEEATPLNCGVATMVSVTEASEIGLGDVVAVQGLGLLGLYGCAMAKARGARRVIGLDSVPERLEAAMKFGADVTVDVSNRDEDEVIEEVRALAPPDGVDVVIEVCGVPDVIPAGLKMLRIGGRYTLGGIVTPDADVTVDANLFVKKWVTLKGIHNYHPRHLIQALDFVVTNRDRFPFKDIVDSKFSLDELNEAFKRASERTVLRAAVVP